MISARAMFGSSLAVLRRHPVDTVAASLLAAAIVMIAVNALYLQPGPHPAPFFSIRAAKPTDPPVTALPRPRPAEAGPRPAAARSRTDVTADVQRELSRRGFYDGPLDGVQGPKTDAAIRDFEQQAGLKQTGEPTEELLRVIVQSNAKAAPQATGSAPPRKDPLGDLIAPPQKRVVAVQRALADYGYAQLKPTGVVGPETRAAIEKFERERRLPVTGAITDRLLRELTAATGRQLE